MLGLVADFFPAVLPKTNSVEHQCEQSQDDLSACWHSYWECSKLMAAHLSMWYALRHAPRPSRVDIMQADAPVATGNGINWYGGPVLNNKAGFVVSPPPPGLICVKAACPQLCFLVQRPQFLRLASARTASYDRAAV